MRQSLYKKSMSSQTQTIRNQTAPKGRGRGRGDLTSGSVTAHLLKMGLPMAWGILAIISFQLADIFFVGKLGPDQLAALSFTIPVTMTVFSLSLGLIIATSSVLSRLIGEKSEDMVLRIATHALFFAFTFGAIMAAVGVATLEPVFRLLGANDTMMPYIREYMLIWFPANIFAMIPMVGNAAIRANGNAMYPAIIMTLVSVVNIILDPLLIFGLWGFPEMGIRGAAIATASANILAMLAALYMLGFHMRILRLRPFYFNKLGDSLKRLAFIAVPAGITSTIQPITNAVIIALLAGYSTEAVAAYGIVSRVEAFAFVVLMGLAGGMAPILGQNYGAKNYDRVFETLTKALSFSAIWAVIVAIILGFGAKAITGVFTNDPTIIHTAALYFWIVPVSYITANLVSGWSSAFNALGMPQRSAGMIFVKYILVQIPAIYVGAHFYGVIGIFVAIAMVNFFVGLFLHVISWFSCKKLCNKNRPTTHDGAHDSAQDAAQ